MAAILRIALVSFHTMSSWGEILWRSVLIPVPAPHHQGPWRAYIHRWNLVRILRWPHGHQSTSIISCPFKPCELVTRCGNWMFSCLASFDWIYYKPKSILNQKGSCRPRFTLWCFPSFWCFLTETFTCTAHFGSMNKSFEMPSRNTLSSSYCWSR